MITKVTLDDLPGLVGTHMGYSDWHEIDQKQVDLFAEATGDHQWIHVDPERAKTGPFGGTIAHGYLTLSLLPALIQETWRAEGMTFGVNYGCNKVRFPAPVKVGSKVRLGNTIAAVEEVEGGLQVLIDATIEVEGAAKPSCVAQVVYRYYR
jgi:acyl dehydratase